MDKDAITSVGVIALLLAVIVAATVLNNRQQLVATRPQVNSVVSDALQSMLGEEKEAEMATNAQNGSTSCPAGCTLKPTPEPAAGAKEQLQSDPIPYVRDSVSEKIATSLQEGAAETVYSLDTPTWWRSDDGYRIKITGGKTLSIQVPTTQTAYQLAPASVQTKNADLHPALRHPLLSQAYETVTGALKKLDYKQVKITNCPVDDAFDPFNNCLAAYVHKKNEQRCLVLARYGQYGAVAEASKPYLRVEVSCSPNYDNSYAGAAPYLYAVNMIDPEWLLPDTAVEGVERINGNQVQVDFGYRKAFFQEIDKGLRLVNETAGATSCEVLSLDDDGMSLHCE